MTRLLLRPLLVLGVAAALSCPSAVITTAATAADTGAVAGSTALDKAKKKGKKGKKKEPLTATVNATLTYTRRAELNGGEETQKITITINDAEATFRDGSSGASGKGQVSVAYEARFFTDNRSWHAGCDTELRESKSAWSGKSDFGSSRPTNVARPRGACG